MASYNLNETLKKSASARRNEQREIKLDDVSRVKVLSPGRQVFKRFIRNRLAVFGAVLLIVMFVFSFFGPIFYSYGQKQIFYKYDEQNVDYALAKENSTYTGYTVDESVSIAVSAANMMNSNVKAMAAAGADALYYSGDSGEFYVARRLGDSIYTLSAAETEKVCTFGKSEVEIGTLDTVKKTVKYAGEDLGADFVAAAMSACKGKGGSFDFNGVTYTAEKGKGKTFDITCVMDGFVYVGEPMDAAFEETAEQSAGGTFEMDGVTYLSYADKEESAIYRLGEEKLGRVFTRLMPDPYETGLKLSNEFRVNALLAAYGDGKFTADGADYTVSADAAGDLIVHAADGSEFADFTAFVVRRYNGEDTMAYDLKAQIRVAIEEMVAAGNQKAAVMCDLPQQNEEGEYARDDEGNLLYNATEMRVTQKDTGEYVINCDQIIYQIDRFASPSGTHLLGTDGDGFDVFARIMYGGRISLMVGFVVVFLESLLGIIMGGLAGYYGGWVDNLIMRLVDIFYCLPSMPIMIILGAMMDALRMDTYIRLMVMMAALGIMGWAGVARLVRGQILSLREQEFMVATEATGVRVKSRIFKHLVPNVMPQLIVSATMGMGGTILTESTLSFLGLGVKHPLATWGTIINSVSSASAMAHYAFIWIPVGLLICLTVVAFNFAGDGLRDAYDPKSKR